LRLPLLIELLPLLVLRLSLQRLLLTLLEIRRLPLAFFRLALLVELLTLDRLLLSLGLLRQTTHLVRPRREAATALGRLADAHIGLPRHCLGWLPTPARTLLRPRFLRRPPPCRPGTRRAAFAREAVCQFVGPHDQADARRSPAAQTRARHRRQPARRAAPIRLVLTGAIGGAPSCPHQRADAATRRAYGHAAPAGLPRSCATTCQRSRQVPRGCSSDPDRHGR
jgi:hypothetical protein